MSKTLNLIHHIDISKVLQQKGGIFGLRERWGDSLIFEDCRGPAGLAMKETQYSIRYTLDEDNDVERASKRYMP